MPLRAHRHVFAAVFVVLGLALSLGTAIWAWQHGIDLVDVSPFFLIAIAVMVLGVSYAREKTPREARSFVKAHAPAAPPPVIAPGLARGTAYRGVGLATPGIATAARRVVPPISASATVIVILACCAFTALALPPLFSMPRWIEIEVVLGAWWLVWAVVLGILAHRGRPLDRDYSLSSDAPPHPDRAPPPLREPSSRWSWLDVLGAVTDLEGIVIFVVGAIVITLAIAATTIVVDFAAPVLFLVAFTGVQAAMRRSLVARHQGQALRSAFHGAAWATLYVAPLAVVIGLTHVMLAP
jgi:hypothetical protein